MKKRVTLTAPSGEIYEIIRATPLTFGQAGLSPMVAIQKMDDVEGKAAANDPDLIRNALDLISVVLSRFMIAPRFWGGHPAESPDGFTTMEDMGEDAPWLYAEITHSAETEAAASAASAFRADG